MPKNDYALSDKQKDFLRKFGHLCKIVDVAECFDVSLKTARIWTKRLRSQDPVKTGKLHKKQIIKMLDEDLDYIPYNVDFRSRARGTHPNDSKSITLIEYVYLEDFHDSKSIDELANAIGRTKMATRKIIREHILKDRCKDETLLPKERFCRAYGIYKAYLDKVLIGQYSLSVQEINCRKKLIDVYEADEIIRTNNIERNYRCPMCGVYKIKSRLICNGDCND